MATRVEQAYGDLDALYDTNQLDGVAASLRYSALDARRLRPNPSLITIESGCFYNSLASYRSALGLYRRFRFETRFADGQAVGPTPETGPIQDDAQGGEQARSGLERDLQAALRRSIAQLEPGLRIVDDGSERNVASGSIDITARDEAGSLVVIELKAGVAGRSAVGQIQSYMGDVADEDASPVRGIIVAHAFDVEAVAAARMVPSLALRTYAVAFTFSGAATGRARRLPRAHSPDRLRPPSPRHARIGHRDRCRAPNSG